MSTTISLNNVLCLVAHSCLTLCDSMDCSPPGSSVHGDSPGKNTRVDCHACLQGIFPTSNPCLLHCRSILYCLNHQGSIILSNMLAFAFLLTMSLKLGTLLLTSILEFYPEKSMATHSSILTWKIPWMEEPGGLQSMRSQRVRHD